MDLQKASLVICLTVVVVVIFNAAIYYAIRRRGTLDEITFIKRAIESTQQPLRKEQTDLEELSQLVEKLQSQATQPPGSEQGDITQVPHDR